MRDLHEFVGYATIVANAIVGVYAVAAWQWPGLRSRLLWAATIVAESLIMVTVLLGVLLYTVDDIEPPRFHMFYGFVAFTTVGLLYSYKYVWKARGMLELAYGLGGLFLMGLGIRAIMYV